MANLDLIVRFNKRYGKMSPATDETKIFAINEAINPNRIEKAIKNSLATMGPLYSRYFDLGLPAEVTLLFIDVCSFSTKFGHLGGEEIADYFDEYYDIIIPIIYNHGGEIDKIIGDGILCIFGPPFLNKDLDFLIRATNNCAKEIITATEGGNYSSKIAFHSGTINYYKNKTGLYKEFTMIGKPLTEIFRLESVSLDEQINYYTETPIRDFYEKIFNSTYVSSKVTRTSEWRHSTHMLPNLKGVDFAGYCSIRHIK